MGTLLKSQLLYHRLWEQKARKDRRGEVATHSLHETVVAVLLSVEHAVLDEDGDGSQDEGHKKVHVNEVPGAVELPAGTVTKHQCDPQCDSAYPTGVELRNGAPRV